MTRSILALLLCTPFSLFAQSHDPNPYGWGPGEIGECVSEDVLSLSPAMGVGFARYFVVGNSLYERQFRKNVCYTKIADFAFQVHGIDVRNYRENPYAVLWCEDGARRYDLETGAITPYVPSGFLTSFLSCPIVSGFAESGSGGCFGGDIAEAELEPTTDEAPEPSLLYEHHPAEETRERRTEIISPELRRALQRLNQSPDYLPSLMDFEIDEDDIRDYSRIVEDACKQQKEDEEEYGDISFPAQPFTPTCESREAYLSLVSRLDEISPQTVRSALSTYNESIAITVWRSASVRLVNQVGDTLTFSASVEGGSQPFLLPWTVTYRNEEFLTWDVQLAHLLLAMLPEREIERKVREEGVTIVTSYSVNAKVLQVIAGYLELLEGD